MVSGEDIPLLNLVPGEEIPPVKPGTWRR